MHFFIINHLFQLANLTFDLKITLILKKIIYSNNFNLFN